MPSNTAAFTKKLKERAQQVGFELVGVAPAATPPGYPSFLAWLDRGYAGEMGYIARRKEAYAHPSGVLPAVKSVVMLGMNYLTDAEPLRDATELSPSSQVIARVARYARGSVDYHDLIRERLRILAGFLHESRPGCIARGVVDTAPLLERDFARLAGLGWFGKNTLLINKRIGSFTFLAGLLTDIELEYDEPHESQHCGTCTRCLDACPTNAFPKPRVLDARRCISYLTIELRGDIPEELRPGIGDWLFGCDICQDVCPWNRKAPPARETAFAPQPDLQPADAVKVLSLSPKEFKQRFGKTPLSRPGRAGLFRNAAIVLGNSGEASAVPVLVNALADEAPVVRGAAAWALGRLGCDAPLREHLDSEHDPVVRQEILNSLDRLSPSDCAANKPLSHGVSSQAVS